MNLVGSREGCGADCEALLGEWIPWWEQKSQTAVALLECGPGYFDRIDAKARNMVRKARRLYTFGEFSWNEHLDDIYRVNTSKPVRCGRPMRGSYLLYPQSIGESDWCPLHRRRWLGGFHEGTLVAYCQLVCLNELGIVNTILGHGDAPAAMNGLIAHMAEEVPVRWINYLTLRKSREGLRRFKRSVGFRELEVA